jgi:hypothetical protein
MKDSAGCRESRYRDRPPPPTMFLTPQTPLSATSSDASGSRIAIAAGGVAASGFFSDARPSSRRRCLPAGPYARPMAEAGFYRGSNRFLRWWPKALLALAVLILFVGSSHAIQWVTLLAAVAYAHGRWLAWQFTIDADGLELLLPFGRRRFFPRSSVSIRIEVVGAVALIGRHRHLGYLLLETIGYAPDGETRLRGAFTGLGYRIV